MAERGMTPFWARDIAGKDFAPQILSKLGEKVYITVDLDVLDPGIMPAVGTPEPGGLGWYETLRLLEMVARERQVVGFDVVELSPLPGNPAPDFLAARLVYKLLAYFLRGSER
jgi:agmatinase